MLARALDRVKQRRQAERLPLLLRTARTRLSLHANRLHQSVLGSQKEVATLLSNEMKRVEAYRNVSNGTTVLGQVGAASQLERARVRAEQMLHDAGLEDALYMLLVYVELLMTRVSLLEVSVRAKQSRRDVVPLPPELREAVVSIIYACHPPLRGMRGRRVAAACDHVAPLSGTVPELSDAAHLFAKVFATGADTTYDELDASRDDSLRVPAAMTWVTDIWSHPLAHGVSQRLVRQLSVRVPSPHEVLEALQHTARLYDVDWQPPVFRAPDGSHAPTAPQQPPVSTSVQREHDDLLARLNRLKS
ncbi:hypothetical protein CDCA_CDCA14G3754 [Cyanidium caldarium]|uniref:Uncharacterized protein n=1 Tax=Cyanidium caldarium TaxID=2771 RepID=A0AAV9IZJ7_CYACA|nr:hypothetical protein CDCA_CDCA14G3754 [Cyanidium caldarium]